MESPKLKSKKVKGKIKVLKVVLYKDHPVYIRLIDKDIFEYLLIHNNEIYSAYIIMTPKEGKKRLTAKETAMASDLIYTGAEATIDALLGIDVDDKTKEYVDLFEKHREDVDKNLNGEK